MSIDSRQIQHATVFNDWTISELVGQGSGGKTAVFKLKRRRFDFDEESVMKVVNIIEQTGNETEMSEEYRDGFEQECFELKQKAQKELELMYKLKDNINIVSYLDSTYSKWRNDDGGFGEDLLIRMNYYKNVGDLMKKQTYEEKEIIQIGIDVSNALIECHNANIWHRDVKPDNIFVDNNNMYMLGDFGISRLVENTDNTSTLTGTRAYAAPEQFTSRYDYRVDIYSLGLTLYELANNNKLPFAKTSFVKIGDIQQRINGKKIELPSGVSRGLGEVILKACEFKPENRYQTAKDLCEALKQVSRNQNTEEMSSEDKVLHNAQPHNDKNNEEDLYATEAAITNEIDLYATEVAITSKIDLYATEVAELGENKFTTDESHKKDEQSKVDRYDIKYDTELKDTSKKEDVLKVSPERISERYREKTESQKADLWYSKTKTYNEKTKKIKKDDSQNSELSWYENKFSK